MTVMKYYLGNALRQQKLRQTQMRKHLWELLGSFLAGALLGLCFGMEYLVKWLG